MDKIKGFKIDHDQWGTEWIVAEGEIEGEVRLSGWMVEAMSTGRGDWHVKWDWWAGDEFFRKEVVVKDRGMLRVSEDNLRATLKRLVELMKKGRSPETAELEKMN